MLDHILEPWKAASFEPWQAMVERQCGSGTGCAAVHRLMGGSCVSSGRLQRASPWYQRCWNCSRVMAGCLPLSQWLSTPARSLMSDPTKSQSRRMRSLAAAKTLAAMCPGVTRRSGRDREVQYAAHGGCPMTSWKGMCSGLISLAA